MNNETIYWVGSIKYIRPKHAINAVYFADCSNYKIADVPRKTLYVLRSMKTCKRVHKGNYNFPSKVDLYRQYKYRDYCHFFFNFQWDCHKDLQLQIKDKSYFFFYISATWNCMV